LVAKLFDVVIYIQMPSSHPLVPSHAPGGTQRPPEGKATFSDKYPHGIDKSLVSRASPASIHEFLAACAPRGNAWRHGAERGFSIPATRRGRGALSGDSVVLKNDAVFLQFIAEDYSAFVVEDDDHLLATRSER
jgi:hypothetical protein